MDAAEPRVPDSVALLWGLRPPARRGRRPSLTLEEITRAAVGIADAEGLGAVSMARVATALGSSTMALYRYVASKDELLLLMADAAFEPPPASLGEGNWRERLTAWAAAVLALLRRHPWYKDITISGAPVGPGNLAWLDRGLAALEELALPEEEKLAVVMGLLPLVHGQARLSVELEAGFAESPESYEGNYGTALAGLLDERSFPALHRAVAAGVFDPPAATSGQELADELDAGFRFALDRFLDGVAGYLVARGAIPSTG
jgi:AcrR family transcriptional regulator